MFQIWPRFDGEKGLAHDDYFFWLGWDSTKYLIVQNSVDLGQIIKVVLWIHILCISPFESSHNTFPNGLLCEHFCMDLAC